MAIAHPSSIAPAMEDIRIRKITLRDLRTALSQGWEDFMEKRGDLVFVGLIYPIAIALGTLYVLRVSILPLLFPIAAGSILLGPAAASGFYELARRREQGLDARWRHFLDVLRGPRAEPLFALSAILTALFVLWIAVAWYIYVNTMGLDAPRTPLAFLQAVLATPEGWAMIVVGNLVGLGFAITVLAISAVSFPMLVDRPVSWKVALRTSVRVAWKNPVTIAAWGLIVVGLLVLGALPALVGLAVVLPVLGYATWHLYTLAVER
ncbi:DUF2189 domain-containing protein [Novosphingobium flavum]|uniref:DUF2189 domain-containing protein n=1 Tax=Novosphingobium flavum TaxID=1778672 RepID=A0A7X1FSD6_9SPHN|nr:DUF2189 domain-containing protein [Novosphingobium flavum]MBC2665467.1 DUF2189 domain-containing protein [Novosphingobium flavum]